MSRRSAGSVAANDLLTTKDGGAPGLPSHASTYADEGWVVAETHGRLIQPDTLSARWKRLERLAGVSSIGLHGTRHTHATLALAAGARLDVVSRQLGHASIAITADVYGDPDHKAASEAAEIVGRVISES